MYPIAVEEVARTLGGPAVLGEAVTDLAGLNLAVGRGFPREVVRELAGRAGTGPVRAMVEALVASTATLKRSPRLSPEASARAERIARVITLAAAAFATAEDARLWLTTAHPMLGVMPVVLAATDLGARQVERLLHNVAYDLPA